MAEAYLGEIRMFSGSYAPQNWALCNGQLLSISQNSPLFSLLGTAYGGDGVNTFALPDLRGRAPMHQASAYPLGQLGGTESVTLTQAQMPAHTHAAAAMSANGTSSAPAAQYWAGNAEFSCYSKATPNTPFNQAALAPAGGNLPHENMMPFVTVSFIIATTGIYPSPN
jgi:microcystin-dependent protein